MIIRYLGPITKLKTWRTLRTCSDFVENSGDHWSSRSGFYQIILADAYMYVENTYMSCVPGTTSNPGGVQGHQV